jgi:hypothetical protein
MAKISTYPNVSTPTLSDMLIGTEVTDNNATKNFQISDILGLIGPLGLYVPYTGATANVDLGTFTLSSGGADFFGPVYLDDALLDSAGNPGTVGQILSSTVTGTQWIDLSSLSVTLQQVLDANNTANQNIILTGASNYFEQTGTNSFIRQTGISSFIQQTGGTAFISQSGVSAFINQSGNSAQILQTGTDSLIQQQGIDAIIRQIGDNARILQTGQFSYLEQQGTNAFIRQTGGGSYIEQQGISAFISQTGANAFITQTGVSAYIFQAGDNADFTQSGLNSVIQQTAGIGSAARFVQAGENSYFEQQGTNAFIQQTGASASIRQTGANAYIAQTGTTGYIRPAQILDSLGTTGVADELLVSLGPGLGVQWKAASNQMGSFYDTTSQNVASGVAVAMEFATNDIVGFGVSVTADGLGNRTQIEVTTAGYYNIQFSAQIRNGAGATETDIWFRKNGTDILISNTSVTLQSNTREVAAWNYFVQLNPGDIFQIMWSHTNAAFLEAAAAAAPHPATPSTILTVNRVR